MSNYKFSISNHHAIKDANIDLNGITVLSGVNGSGKSTISRWLHYSVGGIVLFEDFALREFCEKLISMLYEFNDLHLPSNDAVVDRTYRETMFQIRSLRGHDDADKRALQLFNQTVDYFAKTLETTFEKNNVSQLAKNRIVKQLSIDNKNYHNGIRYYVEHQLAKAAEAHDIYTKKINDRNKRYFDEFVSKYFRIQEDYPKSCSLSEDNVNLISKTIGWLYNIKDSIYIETPIEVSTVDSDNFLWDDFQSQLILNKNHEMSLEEKKIAHRIKQEMAGDIYLQRKVVDDELRYKSLDGKLDIPVKQLATGFKAMTYILRLLENGDLTDKTLLIIDEPEAHLHPQWVVEFARILILIYKKLGAKIVLNSHNPDFISAIQSIAQNENVINDVTFYIAEKAPDSKLFVYKNIGQDVSDIFESFNVALERIEYYGTSTNRQ